jgi:hypothetical protein
MRDCFFVAGTPPAYQEFSYPAKPATDDLARTDQSYRDLWSDQYL